MYSYRITKYNPLNRDSDGYYLLDDWTSVSDVGKTFEGRILQLTDYLEIEQKYIESILMLLQTYHVDKLIVTNLEKYSNISEFSLGDSNLSPLFHDISEGSSISLDSIPNILSLILREYIWAELIAENSKVKITFGYDYYMYFTSDKQINSSTRLAIENMGLFIE